MACNKDVNAIYYDDFGAKGDGVTDDFFAIKAAHDFANASGRTVKAEAGKKYRIHETRVDGTGDSPETITIKTNVDWCGAEIIIDDTDIKVSDGTRRSNNNIFNIVSDYEDTTITDPEILAGLKGVGDGTKKLNLSLGYPALITIYNSNHKVFRRTTGGQLRAGDDQNEILLIDAEGNVDPSTPFMFDYTEVTSIRVHRLDVEPITIKNGIITTWASRLNRAVINENGDLVTSVGYITRGMGVYRPGTVVENVKHYVERELPWTYEDQANGIYGHAYRGFFCAQNTNDVLFKNCVLTGRREYGYSSYDFKAYYVSNLRLEGCTQSNFYLRVKEDGTTEPACDVTFDENGVPTVTPHEGDDVYLSMHGNPTGPSKFCWGISGTNYCKNLEWINCVLSRYDAHCGVLNGKVIGTTINFFALIGKGDFLIENVTWISGATKEDDFTHNSLIYLRSDYGATWNGTITIKDTKAINHAEGKTWLIFHAYKNHYYGYDCHVPNIVIDNLEFTNTDNIELLYETWSTRHETIHDKKVKYDKDTDTYGTFENNNQIVPPEFVKVINNKSGENYIMPYDIPFFYNTKFEIDTNGDAQPEIGYYRNKVYDGYIE